MKDSFYTVLGYREALYELEMKILGMDESQCDEKLLAEYISRRNELVLKTNHLVSVRESVNINNLFNSNWKTYRVVKKYCFEDALDLKNFLISMMQSKGFVYKSNVMDDISEYYSNNKENSSRFNKTRAKIKRVESSGSK